MALPSDALQTGGIVAVAIAALKLVEILALKLFNGRLSSPAGAPMSGPAATEGLTKIREILGATDQEGALLVYYPRKVFNVVEGIARDMQKLQVSIDSLRNDLSEVSRNSSRTMDAVRTCEALNRMKEHQHAIESIHQREGRPKT